MSVGAHGQCAHRASDVTLREGGRSGTEALTIVGEFPFDCQGRG
jgi:hypothetical protein